jgi:hypothetical protein
LHHRAGPPGDGTSAVVRLSCADTSSHLAATCGRRLNGGRVIYRDSSRERQLAGTNRCGEIDTLRKRLSAHPPKMRFFEARIVDFEP